MRYKILQGDNRETLKTLADNSIDAIVTDPPYGIDFLGKDWDANTGALETYKECFRVLKPGGHIVAFSAARTYHHLAITLEQAGFEIRDQIMWIYSSGFPKSQDVGRQIHKKLHGKPDKQRFDPAIMIKVKNPNPNVRDTNGDSLYEGGFQKGDKDYYQHPETGKVYRALPDINGDRLAVSMEGEKYGVVYEEVIEVKNEWIGWGTQLKPAHEPIALARKPISENNIANNCQKWGTGALNIDATRVGDDIMPIGAHEQTGCLFNPNKKSKFAEETNVGRFPANVLGEIQEEYQKYFYCPKVNRKERHIGFNTTNIPTNPDGIWDDGTQYQEKKQNAQGEKGNNHPTVKPVELMKYLIKLITPPNGIVLDPFNGSGSTGMAAVELGYEYIGCELDPNYVEIASKRIEAWNEIKNNNNFSQLFQEE